MRILQAEHGTEEALAIIRSGGIVAHATETCYGFACDLTNPKAVERVFLLKERPGTQPVSALFASVKDVRKWVEWNDIAEQLAEQYLPGPLTIILPLVDNLLPHLWERTIGIRISPFPVAKTLAEKLGKPISTTSANLHGKPSTYNVQEIMDQFKDKERQPDLILDSGVLPLVPPSTVVEIVAGGVNVLRQGAVQL